MNNSPLGLVYNLNIKEPIMPPGPNPPGDPDFQIIPVPFNKPPLIGLKNVGATCYMNATLQCLTQIQELVINFKNNQQVYNAMAKYRQKNKACLTESFKILIDNLWPTHYNRNHSKNSNNFYYAPYDFKDKISTMNPLFKGVQANDAKDLVNFIIMTLHEELNEKQKQNINMNVQGFQNNEKFMLECFKKMFYGENQSIISKIFYGITHTQTKCSNCLYYKHNFEAYFFLIFPLEEVRKYKIQDLVNINTNINQNMMNPNMMNMNMNMGQNMMNMMQMGQQEFQNNLNKIKLLQNNLVDISDCFDYNQKIENFVGENAMYCDVCKRQLPATFQTRLYNAPEVLILVLNRGTGIQFKVKLQFYLQINLCNYIDDKTSGSIYDLIGVVAHMGESGGSGHFIATCRSPIDNNWYQYNDDLVFPVTDFNQQILNYAMPYILFYKKNCQTNNMNNMMQQ